MKANEISFKLSNNLAELDGLNRQLEAFAAKLGLSKRDIFEINLCIEEQLTNIIAYGYTDSQEHWIQIMLSLEDAEFTVCIEDDGVAFDPVQVPPPDLECTLEEKEIGGLGVYLTRHFMDQMVYQRCGNKNVLVMKKKISGNPAPRGTARGGQGVAGDPVRITKNGHDRNTARPKTGAEKPAAPDVERQDDGES